MPYRPRIQKTRMNLDDFLRSFTNLGTPKSAMAENAYGFSHGRRGRPVGLRSEVSFKSKVFITRPQLNLQSNQCTQDRYLKALLVDEPGKFVRMTLDPRLGTFGDDDGSVLKSEIVDNHNGFIPLLSNNLISISGWPPVTAPTAASAPGISKEQSIMIDGMAEALGVVDIDMTFHKVDGNLIDRLLTIWARDPGLNYTGVKSSYIDYIKADTYDYNCRIYQLILADDGKRLQSIACTGISMPVSMPTNENFNLSDVTEPYVKTEGGHVVRFTGVGARYNDPITINNFNEVSAIFNPGMMDMMEGRQHGMVKIPDDMSLALNNQGYPYINIETSQLEWWIEMEKLTNKVREIKNTEQFLGRV